MELLEGRRGLGDGRVELAERHHRRLRPAVPVEHAGNGAVAARSVPGFAPTGSPWTARFATRNRTASRGPTMSNVTSCPRSSAHSAGETSTSCRQYAGMAASAPTAESVAFRYRTENRANARVSNSGLPATGGTGRTWGRWPSQSARSSWRTGLGTCAECRRRRRVSNPSLPARRAARSCPWLSTRAAPR